MCVLLLLQTNTHTDVYMLAKSLFFPVLMLLHPLPHSILNLSSTHPCCKSQSLAYSLCLPTQPYTNTALYQHSPIPTQSSTNTPTTQPSNNTALYQYSPLPVAPSQAEYPSLHANEPVFPLDQWAILLSGKAASDRYTASQPS